jgi:hypothetical protein
LDPLTKISMQWIWSWKVPQSLYIFISYRYLVVSLTHDFKLQKCFSQNFEISFSMRYYSIILSRRYIDIIARIVTTGKFINGINVSELENCENLIKVLLLIMSWNHTLIIIIKQINHFKCIYNECKQKFIKSSDLKKYLKVVHKK